MRIFIARAANEIFDVQKAQSAHARGSWPETAAVWYSIITSFRRPVTSPIELIRPFHAITVAGVQLNRESHARINRKRVINHPRIRYDSTVEWFSTKGVAS